MSDEKKFAAADLVRAQQNAFFDGAEMMSRRHPIFFGLDEARAVKKVAHEKYPLPTITRPRVVQDPDAALIRWRVVGGWLEWTVREVWNRYPQKSDVVAIYPTPGRVALWADLLANPTEEAEAGS